MANKKNRAFERVNREMCWICEENNADSQEHSFKSSRIKALTKEIDSKDPFMTIGEDGRLYPIQGPNSAVVKFGKTICKNCNNSFSKKFDLAYDHLIRFVENDPEYFRDRKILTGMKSIIIQNLIKWIWRVIISRILDVEY